MGETLELIDKTNYDIIFLDLYLPDSRGVESFQRVSQLVTTTPVVILSGLSDKNVARDIVKMGAQDFLVKNEFDGKLLEKAITYSIERKKYQDILQKSEMRYRTTFESVGVAIGEYDYSELKLFLDKKRQSGVEDILEELSLNLKNAMNFRDMIQVENINNEVLHLFEMSSLANFKKNIHLIYTDDTVKHLERLILAIWNDEDYYEKETTYKTKSGKIIHALNRMKLLGNEFGYYRALISVVNISRLKNTEAEVRDQSKLLQAVSESAAAMLSAEEFDVGVNLALSRILKGLNAAAVVFYCGSESESKELKRLSLQLEKKSLKNEIPEKWNVKNTPRPLDKGTGASFSRNEDKTIDKTFLGKSFHHLALAPVVISEKIWGMMAVLRAEDEPFTSFESESLLTVARNLGAAYSRHEAREELEELNEELEQRVKDRTEQLESTNKELESFSYSVSHDLRAPLRAINGFTSVLAEEYESAFDEQGKHFLKNIQRGAQDMSSLIEDLLQFSRLGRKQIQMSPIDMEVLVEEASEMLRAQHSNKEVKLKVKNLEECKGDKAMIRQVLTNVIGNSIKYSHSEKPLEITIGSNRKDDLVEYYIADNGVGFDMKYVDKIFGVFQRLHQDTQFEGTGVGLAIVQRIVTRHGGNVRAEGEVNEGATIYFALPSIDSNPMLIEGSQIVEESA
jgi:signal transduction histidine kinase/DNA-binding response OmpR family regulator